MRSALTLSLTMLALLGGCQKAENYDTRYQTLVRDIGNKQTQMDLEISNSGGAAEASMEK